MPISRDDAEAIAERYAETTRSVRFDGAVLELDDLWFFPTGFIGSRGIIIDRSSGRVSVLGSSPSVSLDDCIWGHRLGFSSNAAILSIARVFDLRRAIDLLFYAVADGPPRVRNPWPRRSWLEQKLDSLPTCFAPQSYWLSIPAFRNFGDAPPFEWSLTEANAESLPDSP